MKGQDIGYEGQETYGSGGGMYDGLAQPIFSVGLKDIAESHIPEVQQLIMDTLEELRSSFKGINRTLIGLIGL